MKLVATVTVGMDNVAAPAIASLWAAGLLTAPMMRWPTVFCSFAAAAGPMMWYSRRRGANTACKLRERRAGKA